MIMSDISVLCTKHKHLHTHGTRALALTHDSILTMDGVKQNHMHVAFPLQKRQVKRKRVKRKRRKIEKKVEEMELHQR